MSKPCHMELEIMKLEALLEHKSKQLESLRRRFDRERVGEFPPEARMIMEEIV